MRRVPNRVIYTYKYGDYFIEICEDDLLAPNEYFAWLSHMDYGVKMFMFGMFSKDISLEEFLDLVDDDLEEQIEIFNDEFKY